MYGEGSGEGGEGSGEGGEGSGEGGERRGRETWITGIHYNDECNYLINCWFLYFLHYLKFWMHLEAIQY